MSNRCDERRVFAEGDVMLSPTRLAASIAMLALMLMMDEVHSMSLANLDGEYCTVLDTAAVLADC
jgi:hypothetical protein